MILILSSEEDKHVSRVTDRLDELGAPYLWFDPAHFPAEAEICVWYGHHGLLRRVLRHRGRELDLATVTAVWNRRPGSPGTGSGVRDELQKKWVAGESRDCLDGLWETLEGFWIPGKASDDRAAHNKIKQLALAARLGFGVPRTLITNSPKSFLEFYAEFEDQIVSKVLHEARVEQGGERRLVFTHVVRRRDTAGYRALRHAPVILQEYVSKHTEIRVTVVGSQVFAAEIFSQASRVTRQDWRHYDLERATYRPHRLPPRVEMLCIHLVQALRLCFGAIDLVLTPEGEYVFLEINPNGQWGWIENLTNLRISEAIAELLVRGVPFPTEDTSSALNIS